MVLFKKRVDKGYEIVREGKEDVLKIDCSKCSYIPSLENSSSCMSETVDKLLEVPSVSRIIFVQRRNYQYSYDQVQLLLEIASVYNHLVKQRKFFLMTSVDNKYLGSKSVELQSLLNLLKGDAIGAYVSVRRILREQRIILNKLLNVEDVRGCEGYIKILNEFYNLLEKTRLISVVKSRLDGYGVGDRSLYEGIFRAVVTPDFMFARLMARVPLDGEEIDSYKIDKYTDVSIFKVPGDIKYLYHLNPPEFKISEDKYGLLDMARSVLIKHKPRAEDFIDPEKMRMTFFNIGRDLLQELAERQGVNLSFSELEDLTNILVRYTVGFGLIEVLLKDEKVQDITINGPIGQTPIFIVHQDYEECVSNIIPSQEDAQGWATKFRMLSGRPLDEANPILDTELSLPRARARVAIVSTPLSPWGLAYAFRRHRDKPWTFPLFIENRMISPLAAGLMSFLVDGSRSLLVAGTRSSGKCVSGDTLIQLGDGNILSIKEMIKGEKEKIDNDFIYREKNPPEIVSLDNYNLKNKRLSSYWKRKVDKKLIKIRTKSGREVVTTEEHPYFTFDKGIKSVFAKFIEKGQFIATPRRIKVQGKKQFINLKSPDKVLDKWDYYLIRGITNANPVKFPKYMDSEFAEFLGYLLGDGHIDECKISFFNSDKTLRERYKKIISRFDVPFKEFKSRTTWAIQITSRLLNRALSRTFDIPLGKKSDKIKIPEEILRSDDDILASFLKSYGDCDGYIPDGKRDLEICTKSSIMAKQLQLVFLRYGIVCFCKKKIVNGENYYRILIRGNFVNKYAEFIGFNCPFKFERLEKIFRYNWIDNSNVDIIPQGDFYLRELRRKLRVIPKQLRLNTGKCYWSYENKEYRVTREWFMRIVGFYRRRYESLKENSWKIGELSKFINLQEKYFDSMLLFGELKKLLDVSYLDLASCINFSDTCVRKLLQKKTVTNLENLNSMAGAYSLLENKLIKLKDVVNFDDNISFLKQWVDNTFLTYADVSRQTGISETMLKNYSYGYFDIPLEGEKVLTDYLRQFKKLLIKNLEKSENLLKNLKINFNNNLISSFRIGMLLGNLRSELNIKNEELVTENLSITTISNFFNSKFENPNLQTITEISKRMVEIYNEVLFDETKQILDTADQLSNSDIFWDEVLDIEEIDSNGEFVYDLTVPGTHNFIANGIIAHNTSFLGAMLLEIMTRYRIITVEDTLEINSDIMRKLGYNIQPMKVRSALTAGETEVAADEGIRSSLRMGDSALIVGEIRSEEARVLFESMRIGAMANVTAGTIHGESPYGVFDRLVNDLKVPRTSFKATDLIVVCNPIKSPDGLQKWKRVVQLTEVRKEWEEDPLRENGFVDLMKYDTKEDALKATDELINGNSEVIKNVASNVSEWVGNWDAVWDNIILRAKIKEALVNYSRKVKNKEILEAKFTIMANDMFHKICNSVKEDVGSLEPRRIYFEWEDWLKKKIKNG